MSETILQEIIDEGKKLWQEAELIFEDYIVPLATQLATDEAALLVKTLEAKIADMQGGFTVGKLAALVPDVLATMASQGLTVLETDVLTASAAILAKIDSLNQAANPTS